MASKESAGVVAASGKVREWPELVVSGCADQTISHIVKGVYRVDGMNHTKPVYKKYEKAWHNPRVTSAARGFRRRVLVPLLSAPPLHHNLVVFTAYAAV